MMDLPGMNKQVLKLAHTWVGTPYKHQAAVKGSGCDCIGLITGIWKELFGDFPEGFKMPAYTPYWAEEAEKSLMVDVGMKYLERITPMCQKMPGDVLMYRMTRRGQTKHAGIYVGNDRIIHAYSGHDVTEATIITDVGSALTYVFRFPESVGEK